MGGSSSRPPPLSLLVEEPWLQMNWEDKVADLQFINNYKPKGEDQENFRILLHGPVGVGKSSFINSVISALEGRISRLAPAHTGQTSFTKEYQSYRIKKGNQGNVYPFVLNDMMGLSNINRRHRRVHVKDMKKVMKGHIKEGYTFNPEKSLSNTDPFYNQKPTINDKVHILVSIFDANTANLLRNSDIDTIQDIRDDATELGIPQVVILTKIDEVCPETKKDVKNVCKSRLLQEKIQLLSKLIGIPENCIFPVKNYHCEKKLNHDMDALVLNALRHIIEIGEEYQSS